jgi:hypothetical protein
VERGLGILTSMGWLTVGRTNIMASLSMDNHRKSSRIDGAVVRRIGRIEQVKDRLKSTFQVNSRTAFTFYVSPADGGLGLQQLFYCLDLNNGINNF